MPLSILLKLVEVRTCSKINALLFGFQVCMTDLKTKNNSFCSKMCLFKVSVSINPNFQEKINSKTYIFMFHLFKVCLYILISLLKNITKCMPYVFERYVYVSSRPIYIDDIASFIWFSKTIFIRKASSLQNNSNK